MATDPTLEEIAAVLDNAKIRNGELRAACPAHGGEDANLSITYDNGKLLARCNSRHCPFSEIMAAIRKRLGETNGRVVNITHGKKKRKKVKSRQEWDVEGVARHVRTEYEDGTKDFSWRLPNGSWGLGGMGTSELPLYGTSEALRVPEKPVVVVEGEKAADALRGADICAVGTVTGANGTPGEKALEPFRGRTMILWPDNDELGHTHMGRVATGLVAVGADVRWFEWSEVDKGDAADHPAIVGSEDRANLLAQLAEARRWSKPPIMEGRVLLGQAIRYGLDPPEELLADLLLAGKAHNIYAPGGIGKTWVLIWIAGQLAQKGKRVLVFDLENGHRTYAERFEEIGAKRYLDLLDDNVHYYPHTAPTPEQYLGLLEEINPDLVMFDSWIGFLASGGRDENVSNDISAWASEFLTPARNRGVATAVLDHVPHEHERERGSSRKRDEMDVVWKVSAIGEFDRDKTGALVMTRMKDREGWLPERLTFEIGGSDEGFVMRRDDKLARTVDITMLTKDEKAVLGLLEKLGSARASEWQKAAEQELEIKHRDFYRVKKALGKKERITNAEGVYQSLRPSTSGRSATGADLVQDTLAPSDLEVSANGAPPYRGCTTELHQNQLGSLADSGASGASRLEGAAPTAPTSANVPFTELTSEEKRRRFLENAKRAYEKKEDQ